MGGGGCDLAAVYSHIGTISTLFKELEWLAVSSTRQIGHCKVDT